MDEETRMLHELAAYEAALRARERRIVSQELDRYKDNLRALMPVENPQPCDFPGCVE
jgi:hypothetical protein